MRIAKLFTGFIVFMFALSASATPPVTYSLDRILLTNGLVVTGTITTDGILGPLTAADIIDWNLKIVQTTDAASWTEKDSTDLNISGVSVKGGVMSVATSPDGVNNGGSLFFGRSAGWGRVPTNTYIADFTELSGNLGFGLSGFAGWASETMGSNFIGLNQKNNSRYRAASLLRGLPNTFRIDVPALATDPTIVTMFGTITTDGKLGVLAPQNIVAWNITVRNQDISYFTKLNTKILYATGLTSNALGIRVEHAAGQFVIGTPGRRPIFVSIADFTDASFPDGFANHYNGGVVGEKFPLVGPKAKSYPVARLPRIIQMSPVGH